jgi:MFS family permease
VFAGLLGDVAEDLWVSVGTAGQLTTLYAIVYAVGSPVLVTLTGAVVRRRLLIFSLAVFAGANVAAVVLSSFGPLLAFRIVAACAAAVFTPTTAVVAASLAAPENRGRALATVTGGLTIAFAFGIPLGTLAGEYLSWRAAFVLVGVLGAIALVSIAALLPVIENPPPVSLRDRILAVEQPAVVAALGLTAIGLGSGFVVFTYVDPLLGDLTGFGGRGISGMLLLFGLAAIAGNALGELRRGPLGLRAEHGRDLRGSRALFAVFHSADAGGRFDSGGRRGGGGAGELERGRIGDYTIPAVPPDQTSPPRPEHSTLPECLRHLPGSGRRSGYRCPRHPLQLARLVGMGGRAMYGGRPRRVAIRLRPALA